MKTKNIFRTNKGYFRYDAISRVDGLKCHNSTEDGIIHSLFYIFIGDTKTIVFNKPGDLDSSTKEYNTFLMRWDKAINKGERK